MPNKLNWYNLKKNKCPQCGKEIYDKLDPATQFFNCPCGFKISMFKFKQIVKNQVEQDLKNEEVIL